VPNVYKITYPNGKIFVDEDLTDQYTWIGSIANDAFAADFPPPDRTDFTVRKEILWSAPLADHDEVDRVYVEWIQRLHANDPQIGYNRWPPPP